MANDAGQDNGVTQLDWGLLASAVGPRARQLRNVLSHRNVDALNDYGLPTGTLSLMCLISANPGCSQTDLAREAGINKSAVVALIDELEGRGYAKRDRSAHDRRRNDLSLTDEGTRLMQEMAVLAMGGEEPLHEAFSKEEIAQLCDLLDRAYQVLSQA